MDDNMDSKPAPRVESDPRVSDEHELGLPRASSTSGVETEVKFGIQSLQDFEFEKKKLDLEYEAERKKQQAEADYKRKVLELERQHILAKLRHERWSNTPTPAKLKRTRHEAFSVPEGVEIIDLIADEPVNVKQERLSPSIEANVVRTLVMDEKMPPIVSEKREAVVFPNTESVVDDGKESTVGRKTGSVVEERRKPVQTGDWESVKNEKAISVMEKLPKENQSSHCGDKNLHIAPLVIGPSRRMARAKGYDSDDEPLMKRRRYSEQVKLATRTSSHTRHDPNGDEDLDTIVCLPQQRASTRPPQSKEDSKRPSTSADQDTLCNCNLRNCRTCFGTPDVVAENAVLPDRPRRRGLQTYPVDKYDEITHTEEQSLRCHLQVFVAHCFWTVVRRKFLCMTPKDTKWTTSMAPPANFSAIDGQFEKSMRSYIESHTFGRRKQNQTQILFAAISKGVERIEQHMQRLENVGSKEERRKYVERVTGISYEDSGLWLPVFRVYSIYPFRRGMKMLVTDLEARKQRSRWDEDIESQAQGFDCRSEHGVE